jgi:hypothetical protein
MVKSGILLLSKYTNEVVMPRVMDEELSELELVTADEVKAFDIFRNKYRALNPGPAKPTPAKQGWEFKAYFVVSIAAVLLASMRTAEQFYRAATFSANSMLGFVEAFLAVFTVEVGIVVYAAVLASRRRQVYNWVFWVGLVLLSSISIVAGLGQSLALTTNPNPVLLRYTQYALSFLIGPGASVAALIGGHILGQSIAEVAQKYEQDQVVYEQELDLYNEKMRRAWQRSFERKVALRLVTVQKYARESLDEELDSSDLDISLPALPKNSGEPSVQSAFVRTVAEERPAQRVVVSAGNGNGNRNGSEVAMARAVTQWLVLHGKTPFDRDVNPVEIADETGIKPIVVAEVLNVMRKNGGARR